MLDSKAARQSWEEMFCERYIEPVLKDINGLLNVSMKKMVNDASLGWCILSKLHTWSSFF